MQNFDLASRDVIETPHHSLDEPFARSLTNEHWQFDVISDGYPVRSIECVTFLGKQLEACRAPSSSISTITSKDKAEPDHAD